MPFCEVHVYLIRLQGLLSEVPIYLIRLQGLLSEAPVYLIRLLAHFAVVLWREWKARVGFVGVLLAVMLETWPVTGLQSF
jgi:hypothetical protein